MKENRELVEQIMKGGEEGVRAYEKLMSKAADKNFEKMGFAYNFVHFRNKKCLNPCQVKSLT